MAFIPKTADKVPCAEASRAQSSQGTEVKCHCAAVTSAALCHSLMVFGSLQTAKSGVRAPDFDTYHRSVHTERTESPPTGDSWQHAEELQEPCSEIPSCLPVTCSNRLHAASLSQPQTLPGGVVSCLVILPSLFMHLVIYVQASPTANPAPGVLPSQQEGVPPHCHTGFQPSSSSSRLPAPPSLPGSADTCACSLLHYPEPLGL